MQNAKHLLGDLLAWPQLEYASGVVQSRALLIGPECLRN